MKNKRSTIKRIVKKGLNIKKNGGKKILIKSIKLQKNIEKGKSCDYVTCPCKKFEAVKITTNYDKDNVKYQFKCNYCNKTITGEYHCEIYDTPPFFCSERCYGKRKMKEICKCENCEENRKYNFKNPKKCKKFEAVPICPSCGEAGVLDCKEKPQNHSLHSMSVEKSAIREKKDTPEGIVSLKSKTSGTHSQHADNIQRLKEILKWNFHNMKELGFITNKIRIDLNTIINDEFKDDLKCDCGNAYRCPNCQMILKIDKLAGENLK